MIENQDTILEQNEVNCLNDSKDFKDAESVRSGLSHVPSQPSFFPPFRDQYGMLSRSVGLLSRNDKPPDIWETHGISGNVFVSPPASFLITLSTRGQSVDVQRVRTQVTACNG